MNCSGIPKRSPYRRFEPEAAQLRVFQLFSADFLKRFPDGVVISELEYMGRTTSAPNVPGALQYKGQHRINKVLAALSSDFRRWIKDRDYRKPDALGISQDASIAELVEVTTGRNADSAIKQIKEKIAILRDTVNRIHNLNTDWRPTKWRPSANEVFFPLPPNVSEVPYICYNPTFQLNAPPGVILYEVHSLKRKTSSVPVIIPADSAEKLRSVYKSSRPNVQNSEQWAKVFLQKHPALGIVLRGLALIAGAALVISAIILIFDPVPGDEIAAASAASWLLSIATSK